MTLRIASAAIGLPLLILIAWTGSPWFSILVALAAVAAGLELSYMALQWDEFTPAPVVALLAVALIAVAHIMTLTESPPEFVAPLVAAASIASLAWLLWHRRSACRRTELVTMAAIALYVGGFLFHAPLLRSLDQGLQWVLFLLLVTFATDSAAFFVGRAIGRRPLAPTISPSKTWEGVIGGIAGALTAGAVATFVLGLDARVGETLLLGGMIGVAGQCGDLAESRLKRMAGVKDSGWLIPGHGGILDRMDSIVFNLLVVYYFVSWEIQRKGLLF
jgi:phosphatidate cytidylyltransferase